MFEVGRIYDRRCDIHAPYGDSWQSGISPSADWPFVFLFSGESGTRYGYQDGWDDNGVFLYTGEGQVGHMEFSRGNRALRDHAADGKDLHLFESLGKGKGCRYMGMFACSSWEFRQGVDRNGDLRRVIVFHLVQPEDDDQAPPDTYGSLDQLRARALKAASEAQQRSPREARRLYHERSAAVREYVLARADGICESCGNPAPFKRPDGTPYLEPHHTRKISDGGPDHPRWVGAVCPNCHKEIHRGIGGEEKNRNLEGYLASLEGWVP